MLKQHYELVCVEGEWSANELSVEMESCVSGTESRGLESMLLMNME